MTPKRRSHHLPAEVRSLHGLLIGLERASTFEEIFRALAESLLIAVDRADDAWVSVLDVERLHLSDVLVYTRTGLAELDAAAYPLTRYPQSRRLLERASGWEEYRVTSGDLSAAGSALAGELGWRSMVEFPLVVAGRSEGLVEVSDHTSARRWARRDLELMDILVFHAGAALKNATLLHQFRTRAERDELTGVLNRSRFLERLDVTLQQGAQPIAVAFVDLDGFKAVNDLLGHAAGDTRLRCAADAMSSVCRQEDFIGRIGGDEFGVAFAGWPDATNQLAKRLDDALRAASVPGSVGVVQSTEVDNPSPAALIGRADLRMLTVKRRRQLGSRAA